VWQARAPEPEPWRKELEGRLVLDRERLGATDSSLSRAENAVWLEPRGSALAELVLPERCSNSVLVVHECDFESLSQGLAPHEQWDIAPRALARRGALVRAARSSLALVRSQHWDRPGAIDHLLTLPRVDRLMPGERAEVEAPALFLIGEAAVMISPGETVLPKSEVEALPGPRSFRLPPMEISSSDARELDKLGARTLPDRIELPHSAGPCGPDEFPGHATRVLATLRRPYAFVPVQVDEREPRLALLYLRPDRSTGALVSGKDIAAWLVEVERALVASERPDLGPSERPVGQPLDAPVAFGSIRTRDATFARVLARAASAAPSDLRVLLLGESGTGKEFLGRAIHDASRRSAGPFHAVNCSSIPDGLIESELFGHKQGAFSGTRGDRKGAFLSAHGGTLLLDEVGDAPARVQFALLRVLESRRVRPVGSDEEIPVDVRVLSATSRDVRRLIQEQTLREDLFFRLSELTLTVPPLRERSVDLPLLCSSLLTSLGCSKPLTEQALERLRKHHWKGNVRELLSALKVAKELGEGAEALGSECFSELDPLNMAQGMDPPFGFPDLVRGFAEQSYHQQTLIPLPITSTHEVRAMQRAALLYLKARYGSLPPGLSQSWSRLFGSKWATSEDGRGPREVLKVLGCLPTDEKALAWVVRRASG
jgi:hypothetical protein